MILSGHKRQTIRAIGKKRHAKPGDILYLYTGMRTKNCQKIKTTTCISSEPCYIDITDTPYGNIYELFVSGEQVKGKEAFVKADGFKTADEFFTFFNTMYQLPFNGVLIKW